MLNVEDTALAVIDVQGKLAGLVHANESVISHIRGFIEASRIFGLPVIWSEQAPDKIGETIGPIKELLLPLAKPIHKRTFSCWGTGEYVDHLQAVNRRQILVTGIETHVCVYQTARDLHRHGWQVHLITDAVSSRHEFDHHAAVDRMREEGITISSFEMAICELLQSADNARFKEIMAYIKR